MPTKGLTKPRRGRARRKSDHVRIRTPQTPAASAGTPETDHVRILLADLKPSPENDAIYTIRPGDPAIKDLAADIKKNKLLQDLVVTEDRWIVSGHRRYAALQLLEWEAADCKVLPVRRDSMTKDEFVQLLVAHNNQRVKTFSEKLHEEAVKINPDEAYRRLMNQREERSSVFMQPIKLGACKARAKISAAKMPMLEACQAILRRFTTAISDRKIHYELLNDPPLKHASKPHSRYMNDGKSYHDLCNLLTRARMEGLIGWDEISDETRPVTTWSVWDDPQPFLREKLDDFLKRYWRDLMQSQPNHVELLAEKNTVAAQCRDVCGKYRIPMISGRGFCSSPPRYEMAERYRESGKDKLIVLIVSDLDPSGMVIAESFARSMRDDFDIADVHAVKVAITIEQVRKFKLPHGEKAKGSKDDPRRVEFVKRYGEYTWEVEALPGGELRTIVDEAIRSVIDLDAYNHEVEQEKEDARQVEATRNAAMSLLKGIDVDAGDEDDEDDEEEDAE